MAQASAQEATNNADAGSSIIGLLRVLVEELRSLRADVAEIKGQMCHFRAVPASEPPCDVLNQPCSPRVVTSTCFVPVPGVNDAAEPVVIQNTSSSSLVEVVCVERDVRTPEFPHQSNGTSVPASVGMVLVSLPPPQSVPVPDSPCSEDELPVWSVGEMRTRDVSSNLVDNNSVGHALGANKVEPAPISGSSPQSNVAVPQASVEFLALAPAELQNQASADESAAVERGRWQRISAKRSNGVCVSRDGRTLFAACQRTNTVFRYDCIVEDGRLAAARRSKSFQTTSAILAAPRKLCLVPPRSMPQHGEHDTLLVCDSGNNRVVELHAGTGAFLREIGVNLLERPHGVACDGGVVVVSEPASRRLVVFNYISGNLLRVIDCSAVGGPAGVCFHPGSRIVVAVCPDSGGMGWVNVSASGSLFTRSPLESCGFTLRCPRDVAMVSGSVCVVCDSGGDRLVAVDLVEGRLLGTLAAGICKEPSAVCVDGGGALWIAHAGSEVLVRTPWHTVLPPPP